MGHARTNSLIELVKAAGVVGAGGAGFPTYQKLSTKAELVIANGAECEPLLYKDHALMENHPQEVLSGLLLAMDQTGASMGVIAIKEKSRESINALTPHLPANVSILEMEDVYPAGDEYEIVYLATGKRIPAGGYPPDIGVVVQNVETLYNVHRAVEGYPVTHSILTVTGHVKRPFTAWVPLGTSYSDLIGAAGGLTIEDFVLIDGGAMMGGLTDDLTAPVTRLTSGLIAVPADSKVAVRKGQPEKAFRRFGKSACDQCSLCTEMCPRYLLGYPIQPHLVMRSLLTTGEFSETLTHWAQACCECNVCSLWACPENLDPKGVCATTKRDLRDKDLWLSPSKQQDMMKEVHQLKEYRNVPTGRLMRRLGLTGLEGHAGLVEYPGTGDRVDIPVSQHVGAAAVPLVTVGSGVRAGDKIARADSGLSVPVHASIDGTVVAVGDRISITK